MEIIESQTQHMIRYDNIEEFLTHRLQMEQAGYYLVHHAVGVAIYRRTSSGIEGFGEGRVPK